MRYAVIESGGKQFVAREGETIDVDRLTVEAGQKVQIQGAKCMGCGSCVAACPARAIQLQHQEDRQLVAALDELLAVPEVST